QNQLTVSRPSVKDESFRIVLHMAMSPPRDTAVPLPVLPQPMMKQRKKLGHQETMFSEEQEENFKCSAFCLSLSGFGKQKPVRSPKSEDSPIKKKTIKASSFSNSAVSLSASLEKFECGSWASTTALARENGRLYFDLPVEMIKCGSGGGGDVQEPVSSGFFFDKETGSPALRSVLKTSLSVRQQRGSVEMSPQRRVRFSTTSSVSCPTSPRSCITPRLLKARDDFNTFLAAQNA
ncbi:BnaUnng01900D, partial [Brassica napus]